MQYLLHRRGADATGAVHILLHDAFVDTVPSGYNKKSPNPDRPGFCKNAITLYAWLT